VDGTFQQYCVANAAHVARLDKSIDLAEVAPILCAGITVYKGLKESGAKPGQTVAIVGAGGGLGSLAQQYAKAMGLQVVAIDSGAEKRDMSLNELGALAFVDFKESKDVVADVRAAANNGQGPHAVVLVAVSEKPFHQISHYPVLLKEFADNAPRCRIRSQEGNSCRHWSAGRRVPESSRV
jgi:propanol-preferring alcohol dehydrogenase